MNRSLNTVALVAVGSYLLMSQTSMALMNLGFIALVAGALIYAIGTKKKVAVPPGLRTYGWLSFALFSACMISAVVSVNADTSWLPGFRVEMPWVKHFSKFVYYAVPFLLFYLIRGADLSVRSLLRLWVGSATFWALVGCIQFFLGWPRPWPSNAFGGAVYHANGIMGSYLSYANAMIFPFFFLLTSRQGELWSGPALFRIMLAIQGIALLFTLSRAVWLSLAICFTIFLVLRSTRKLRSAVIALLLIVGASLTPPVQNRFSVSGGINERIELWKANWDFFKERPVFGIGWRQNTGAADAYFARKYPGEKRFIGHAHNQLIDMLASTGLLGLGVFLLWLSWALTTAFRAHLGFGLGWLAFLISGLTQVNYWDSKVMHTWLVTLAFSILMVHPTIKKSP